MPSSVWIERGPDGRPCYVKKKTAVPSLRKKFAEAFDEIRQRTQQPSSTTQNQSSTQTATAPTQPTSSTSNSRSQSDMTNQDNQLAKNAQPQGQIPHMAYYPGHLQFQAFNPYQFYHNCGAASNPYAAYQRPFPAVPPGFPQLAQAQGNSNPTSQATTSAQVQAPTTTVAQQDFMTAAQADATKLAMAQMTMKPDGLKFKCIICGRFRSSRYHLKHRLASGQLPGPTICRRCRKHTTDSEDETSDSEEDELLYRSRSAVRRRSRSRGRVTRAVSRARASSRAPKHREDFDYYALHSLEDSSSESEDFPARPARRQASRSRKANKGRSKSVRYVDEPLQARRSKSKIRKIIYMQEPDDQSDSTEDEVEVRYIKQAPEYVTPHPSTNTANDTRNAIVRSRPGTPAPPGLLRPHSDEMSQPNYVEQRVYYDEPPASFAGKSMPPPEFNSHNPYRHVQPPPAAQHYPFPPTGQYRSVPGQGPPYFGPDHHLPTRGDARSRSRGHFGVEEGQSRT